MTKQLTRRAASLILCPYVLAGLSLTWVSHFLHARFKTEVGLARSFSLGSSSDGARVLQRTSEISLECPDSAPNLPRRLFTSSWEGVWYLPREQTIAL